MNLIRLEGFKDNQKCVIWVKENHRTISEKSLHLQKCNDQYGFWADGINGLFFLGLTI